MASNYNLIILGNGAAAFSAAIKATEITEGKVSILMVGSGELGGTCVNVGCVPSKYLLEASNAYYSMQHPRFEGLEPVKPNIRFKDVMYGLRLLVSKLRESKYADILKSYTNIDYIEGNARFLSSNEVEVNNYDEFTNGRVFKGDAIIVATGSRPSIPNIEGLNDIDYLTSNTIWKVDELPDSIAVIGAGAIGLEIGQALLHFGSDVTVIDVANRVLANAEPELSLLLQERLAREGMNLYMKARISNVKRVNGKKVLDIITSNGKEQLEVDHVFVASGRSPNTDTLRLDRAGVEANKQGFIITDDTMLTSNPSIYAAGDCVAKRFMLETLAAREGVIAASNIFGIRAKMDYLHVPWVIFTDPQIASVGFGEGEYVNKYGSCLCRVIKLDNVPKALILNEDEGLVKMVIDPSSRRIVGLHIAAYNASEYIIEGSLAIKLGLTIDDIINTVHAFPTLAESIKIVAQSFVRDIKMMSCCVE
ncbi:MAG: mercury(II) reductase [Candidatus Nitrosocaldus sp.]